MRKAHRKTAGPLLRRASRIFLNAVNAGKAASVRDFLQQCRDVTQYFVECIAVDQRSHIHTRLHTVADFQVLDSLN